MSDDKPGLQAGDYVFVRQRDTRIWQCETASSVLITLQPGAMLVWLEQSRINPRYHLVSYEAAKTIRGYAWHQTLSTTKPSEVLRPDNDCRACNGTGRKSLDFERRVSVQSASFCAMCNGSGERVQIEAQAFASYGSARG